MLRGSPGRLIWAERLSDARRSFELIWRRAQSGTLGDGFRELCETDRGCLELLQSLTGRLTELLCQMQEGLVDHDLNLSNTGWRRETGQMLHFDLAHVGLSPRFLNVAGYLGPPYEQHPHIRCRAEFGQYYLEQYARWGGQPPPLDQFLREIRVLWMASVCSRAYWHERQYLTRAPTNEGVVFAADEDMTQEDRRWRDQKRNHLCGEMAAMLREARESDQC